MQAEAGRAHETLVELALQVFPRVADGGLETVDGAEFTALPGRTQLLAQVFELSRRVGLGVGVHGVHRMAQGPVPGAGGGEEVAGRSGA